MARPCNYLGLKGKHSFSIGDVALNFIKFKFGEATGDLLLLSDMPAHAADRKEKGQAWKALLRKMTAPLLLTRRRNLFSAQRNQKCKRQTSGCCFCTKDKQ
ncbi:hypothetical protein BaRGS_00036738 [Batillaria attramentaria]|uniref:Uncharacterized protein n=1 Tax=Batillaria attramentaria TaxID=370345 RepID=A0ABD0JB64_9CAEN